MTMWISAALPYIGGGVLGAVFTYGLTWFRERRRTLDAYRAPQRQAIGDIITATHELMVRELEMRTGLTELVECIRQDELPSEQALGAPVAMGKATLDAERAFEIGTLTIVDAPCWEAMGAAYIELTRLRAAMHARADAPDMQTPEEIETYVERIRVLSEQFSESVLTLVRTATERVTPAETIGNRRRRRDARQRLGERYAQLPRLSPPTDGGQ
jgi:hypothetical protein